MRIHALTTLGAVSLLPLALCSSALAGGITFVVHGDITNLEDQADLTGGATTWTWTYSFHSEAADQEPDDPTVGVYATLSSELTLGSLTLCLPETKVQVRNNHGVGWDGYGVESLEFWHPDWIELRTFFDLENFEDLTVIESDALPLTPPDLRDFPVNLLDLIGKLSDSSQSLIVGGLVTSIGLASCPWDLNGDSEVGINDFLNLLQAWGTDPCSPPDFNGDGVVDTVDFLELLAHWGPCP
jgi:hypothetical protein